MTALNELKSYFYDLILLKALTVYIKSTEIFLELTEGGKAVVISSSFVASFAQKGDFSQLKDKFSAQSLVFDRKSNQIYMAKKHDFTSMSPDVLALKIAEFHKLILEVRSQLGERLQDIVPCGTLN